MGLLSKLFFWQRPSSAPVETFDELPNSCTFGLMFVEEDIIPFLEVGPEVKNLKEIILGILVLHETNTLFEPILMYLHSFCLENPEYSPEIRLAVSEYKQLQKQEEEDPLVDPMSVFEDNYDN